MLDAWGGFSEQLTLHAVLLAPIGPASLHISVAHSLYARHWPKSRETLSYARAAMPRPPPLPPPARVLDGPLPGPPPSAKCGGIASNPVRQPVSIAGSDDISAGPVRWRWLHVRSGAQLQPHWKANVDHCYTVWAAPGSKEEVRGVHCGGFIAWQALEARFPCPWYEKGVWVRRFANLDTAVAAFFDPQEVSPRVNVEIDRRVCPIEYWASRDNGESSTEIRWT